MTQYSLWFRFRAEVEESTGLALVQDFLSELQAAAEIAKFQILRNRSGDKTTRLPFLALIEFRDTAHFSAAFSTQAKRGIHNGLHGQVMALVEDFQIEIFEAIAPFRVAGIPEQAREFACAI